jgi:hypothetical protein
MRQLQWGSAWVEVLFNRQEAGGNTTPQERSQAALQMVATVLEYECFQAASTARRSRPVAPWIARVPLT